MLSLAHSWHVLYQGIISTQVACMVTCQYDTPHPVRLVLHVVCVRTLALVEMLVVIIMHWELEKHLRQQ